jgi:hypothetical protein
MFMGMKNLTNSNDCLRYSLHLPKKVYNNDVVYKYTIEFGKMVLDFKNF